MYNDYFGLREAPFSIAPNPQYLYMSERHREALAHLLYGIRSDGGFILLTGEVGTGKTTVCRCLLEQIPEDVDTAFILNPKLTASELLATACDDLHIDYPKDASIKVLVDSLNDFLLRSHQLSRRTVLIIDEAQNLSVDVLEQLRLLTNLETNQRKLLQIILLGQPELLTLLARQELRQLSQRVTARFHLDALTQDEVGDYIQHRLDIAGAKGALFPQSTIRRIYKISKGIPRIINLVCDRALLGTYVQNKLQVDIETLNKASKEVLGDLPKTQFPKFALGIAASVVLVIAVAFYFISRPFPAEAPNGRLDTATPDVSSTDSSQESQIVPEETAQQAIDNDFNLDTPTHPIDNEHASNEPGSTFESKGDGLSTSDESSTIANFTEVNTDPVQATQIEKQQFQSLSDAIGYSEQPAAFAALFKLWGRDVVIAPDVDPCSVASGVGLECLSKLGSLRDIAHLNRPVIINLTTTERSGWFIVSSMDDHAIEVQGQTGSFKLRQQDVLAIWSGFYTLFWRTPPAYEQPLKIGDSGEAVKWLRQQLALADKLRPQRSTAELTGSDQNSDASITLRLNFNQDLERRVKRFQISVGLVPDGIVGAQTWIHLNSVDAVDVPMIRMPGVS